MSHVKYKNFLGLPSHKKMETAENTSDSVDLRMLVKEMLMDPNLLTDVSRI